MEPVYAHVDTGSEVTFLFLILFVAPIVVLRRVTFLCIMPGDEKSKGIRKTCLRTCLDLHGAGMVEVLL